MLLGPPGAGKGTHAQVLSKHWNIAHVSTGDMLREALRAATPLGLKAKKHMEKGGLVPDDVVIGIVGDWLKKNDTQQGFVLDGFPRTKEQAESLDTMLRDFQNPLDLAIYFKTSLAVIIRRLSGRRLCGKCGRTYHLVNFKPTVEGVCDDCQGELMQRPDDREAAIENRLEVYEKQTAPLIEYYKRKKILAEVSGDLEVEALSTVLQDLFRKKGLDTGSVSQNRRRT